MTNCVSSAPVLLWLAVLFLSRAITLPAAMGIGSFANVNPSAIAMFRKFWSVDAILPSAIAVVVLFALFRRSPNAGKAVRWIWARGRVFLALSAGIDILLCLIAPLRHGQITEQDLWSLVVSGFDAYFLLYILAARRVRDTFSDFPVPLDGKDA